LVYITWGHGVVLPKTTFRTNTDGVWARETPHKFWDPLLISTTAEDIDLKFGIQLGLREYDTKTTFTTKNGVGVS